MSGRQARELIQAARDEQRRERLRAAAPVSAVAGPEPDEGGWERLWTAIRDAVLPLLTDALAAQALGRKVDATAVADMVADRATDAALSAAPAAAPVGDEGRKPWHRRYGNECFECHEPWPCSTVRALAPPGDEGAGRAAVARVLALCDEWLGSPTYWTDELRADTVVRRLRAALSAVSGEHREAGDGQ